MHHREDESFVVLDGALTVRVGDAVFHAEPGSFVLCPRDVPQLLSVDSETVRMLTLCTPGGLGVLFAELGRPAPDRTVPVGEPEPDAGRIATLAGHYGAGGADRLAVNGPTPRTCE